MRRLAACTVALCMMACDAGDGRPDDDVATAGAPTPDVPYDTTDDGIERLPPAAFPGLPDAVREELAVRGCTVPQAWVTGEPHNVVSGELATRGQVDVAVLCSRDGASSVVVLWGGPVRCADTMEASPDDHWTQNIGGGLMGYSRALGVSGPGETFAYLSDRGYDGPPLDHDVLSDAFIEKASTLYYCHDGDWLALGGAD